MTPTRLLLVFPLLLTFLAALLGACGGGAAPLSDEEYFSKLTELDRDADQRGNALAEDATAGDFQQLFSGIASDYTASLNDVEPPDDVKDAHEELISALDEFRRTVDGIDIDADAPPEEFFASTDLDFERTNNAFCAIQDAADQKGIESDVGCDAVEEVVDPSTLPAQETTEVLMEGFAFDPPHIQVAAGDTVTWTQGADGEPHNATADDDTFASKNLEDEGETFEFTFEEPGEFSYFCTIHPEMLGLVTVTE